MELINKMETKNKNKRPPTTTITISHDNYEKLKTLGTCGMSFNDVLTMILAKVPGAYKINVQE